MIDLHSRILPGLDDGATDLAGALEIARAAVADGITAIAATRHVREDYPTTADAMEGGVRQLRTALERDASSSSFSRAARSRPSNSTASHTTSCADSGWEGMATTS